MSKRGMVAVECEDGEYTVFELIGDELEVGDTVVGCLSSLGGGILRRPQGGPVRVFVEDWGLSRHGAIQMLRRIG